MFTTHFIISLFQYVENVPKWGEQCEITAANVSAIGAGISDPTRSTKANTSENSQQDINTLESTIHLHQSLYESMCQVGKNNIFINSNYEYDDV